MKKKIYSFLLALVLFIPCLFIFSACNKNEDPPAEPQQPTPANYTLTDIQNMIHSNLSSGFGNVDIDTVMFDLELANKSINGKNILGLNMDNNTTDYCYLNELKLITYKSSDNKYYYANRVVNPDINDSLGSVTFNNATSTFANVELVKNINEFTELTSFDLYLCQNTNDNSWHLASYSAPSNYSCGNTLTTTQLNWFFEANTTLKFKEDLVTQVVHEDTESDLKYYKVSLTNPTNKYLALASSTGYRLAEIGYTHSDIEIDSSLITFLSKYEGTNINNADGYTLHNIHLTSYEDLDLINNSIRIDYDEYNDDKYYYLIDENGDMIYSQLLSDYGIVNCKEFECVVVHYLVAENGKYYEIIEYEYGKNGTPSFYNSNSTIVVDSNKVELTKAEYNKHINEIGIELLNNIISVDDYIINAQQDIDTITALFGDDAFKSSFSITDGSTADNFTAIIESTTYMDNYTIPQIYVTNHAVDYTYNSVLINEKTYITFSNSKLSSISVTWELQDQFKTNNTPNFANPYTLNLLNEQELFKITFMNNADNLRNLNVDDYKDMSLTTNDNVTIRLRNVFGGNISIQTLDDLSTNSTDANAIKAGSTISRSSIDALVADRLPEGITIENWYLDSTHNTPAFENGILNVSKSSNIIILYAKYNNMPTITMDLDGGIMGEISNSSIHIGDNFEDLSTPYKKGYEFVGFYTDAALTQELDYEAELTSNITLYAKYSKLHLIEFDTKGGTEIGNKLQREGKIQVTLPTCVEKLGYVFKGWKLVGGDDTLYNERYIISGDGITTNLKFEAVYDEGIILHVYIFDSNNEATLYKTITINKTCPEDYSFANLYNSLIAFVPDQLEFNDIYLNAELTTTLSEWPTSECNIYLK